jgi:2,4-dienoyl-CoA reductase-like NADH-dependent reductase (Old Yellow Enzyme family)
MSFDHILSPIKIGDVEIKNRVVMSPMNMAYSTQDGYATPQDIAHLTRRAKGGFGLIISPCILTTKLSAPFVWHRNLYLYDESFIPGLNMMVEAVHSFGAKIFAQLSIGFGRQGHAIDRRQPYAPSAIPLQVLPENTASGFNEYYEKVPALNPRYPEIPREMTIEEILEEEKQFGEACRRAVIAGFDGIEIHAPHGYLEHQFLSSRSNKRTDLYGGCLENRARFLIEVAVHAFNDVTGAIPIGIRMAMNEHMPEGVTIDEVKIVARTLQKLGLAYMNLSDGCYEASKYFAPESIEHVEQHLLKEAKSMKEVLSIPTITPSVHDPTLAERAIKDGETDMIGLGRQSLADPDWPSKVKSGKVDSIKRCKRDCMCFIRCLAGLYPRCTVNPEVGFEQYDSELFQKKREGAVMPKAVSKLPVVEPEPIIPSLEHK